MCASVRSEGLGDTVDAWTYVISWNRVVRMLSPVKTLQIPVSSAYANQVSENFSTNFLCVVMITFSDIAFRWMTLDPADNK